MTREATREPGIAALDRVRKPSRLKGLDAKTATGPGRKPDDRTAIAAPTTPRVAVIGLGYWGPNLVRNFYSVLGENLRACCDRQSQRGQFILQNYPGIRFTDDIEVILGDPDIDALAIATPVDTHYPLAKAALTAGKSVLVEKPMCSTAEQAEELVDLADRNGKVLMVDHTFVYNPAVRKMKEVVDSGQLGELLFIDSIRINLGIFQHDVNVVWDLAPHDLSIVQYLVGRAPRSLSAFGAAHAGNGIESIAYINLDFGDGLIANFHVNWLSPVKIRHTVVGGRKRSLIYNDLDPIEKVKIYDRGITVRHDDLEGRRRQLIEYRTGDIWAPHIAQQEPLRTMVTHFIDCLREHKRPMTDGRAGLEIVRILDAAQRSIKAQGGRITL
ncbi:MAG TPA: Gfo/Idh/MocA family oxidoreductase [Phycisphaerae bacterium]|nr:Gfo/Idh/MocA family oxidoreductase [Phycisphaerae bacterium]HRY66529.1 Gfo/Idh/MocA family oxidoreductase [Phycisphaerae bacterium]HSA28641.1 Gfo/Idh/MocA family oxidoreductase [Phycisphaerae bacterium]